jgi:hypothetical protein
VLCTPYKSALSTQGAGIACATNGRNPGYCAPTLGAAEAGNRAKPLGKTPGPRGYDCRLMLRIT